MTEADTRTQHHLILFLDEKLFNLLLALFLKLAHLLDVLVVPLDLLCRLPLALLLLLSLALVNLEKKMDEWMDGWVGA